MRDWKKAFGQPDDGFTLRVQQTLLAIEEKEEEPVKKKMTLSLAFACVLFVTVLALSALAASNILGEKPDETLSPGENSIPEPTDAPTLEPELLPMITTEPTPMPTLVPMVTPMPTPTPMPMEPASYWTTPYGNYYHLDEFCSGMEDAMRVSFETAMNMGKQPCPVCVVALYRGEMQAAQAAENEIGTTPLPAQPGDGEGIALMTDFNQPLRQGEAWGWGIDLTDPNNDDFHVGSEPLNSENNGVWTNDILTVHNIVFLKTRSAIFMEFEYSMNDDAIDPWSIRITPCMEGEAGPLGWHDARVHEVSGEDNTIRYLLSVITDSPADFPNITNLWVVYGGGTAEEQRLLGSLGNNLDWGRRYGR